MRINYSQAVRGKTELANKVVGFSVSYDPADGAALGIGAEHLREAILQIARPLLRAGAALAYGGNFNHYRKPVINFTLALLDLIREEQQDLQQVSGQVGIRAAGLYNHQAWPGYLAISKAQEAEWINCCQLVRVSQTVAGIAADHQQPDDPTQGEPLLRAIHGAVCESAMRRIMATGCEIPANGLPAANAVNIPAVSERIVIGGKLRDFGGVMPGIFEETLAAVEARAATGATTPLYILGGFGGAAGVLAQVLTGELAPTANEFTTAYYAAQPAKPGRTVYRALLDGWTKRARRLPASARSPEDALSALRACLVSAAHDPQGFCRNGLSTEDNRALLTTIDPLEASRLVLKGLLFNT